MVFQERHAIRDGHLDSSIKSPPVFLLHDLPHRKFAVDSPPLHIIGTGQRRRMLRIAPFAHDLVLDWSTQRLVESKD
jgi:hypothetical protein